MRRFATSLVLLLVVTASPASAASIGRAAAIPGLGTVTTSAVRVAASGAFVERRCPHGVFPAGLDVDCGFIRVPEDRSLRHGRMIKVAAAVVHSTAAQPAADPILVLPGGPSSAAIAPFYYANYFQNSTWAADHDLVFVDTRGTGSSTPRLGCPEVDAAEVSLSYHRPYVGGGALQIIGGALEQCRRRLVAHRIDPAAYTTSESVADLEELRTALGVPQWNLLSISADGLLGMSYVREHPESIRADIVDSGLSPQMKGFLDYDRGVAAELDAIFRGCAANGACAHRYPHLRRAFLSTVRRLTHHPQVIVIPGFRPHPVRLVVDGAGAFEDALNGIYPGNHFTADDIHGLIDDMWRESHGHLVSVYRDLLGTGPVTNDHADRFMALGRTMSYECHDVTNFLTRDDLRQAARDLPMFAERYLGPHFDLGHFFAGPRSPAGCRIWKVGRAGRHQHRPVVSDVPTLLLAGEYDTGVPPYIVRQNGERLTRSTYVEFPGSGHLQLASYNDSSACARPMAEAFLRAPTAPVDTSCVASIPAFDFTPGRSSNTGLDRISAVEPRNGPQPW